MYVLEDMVYMECYFVLVLSNRSESFTLYCVNLNYLYSKFAWSKDISVTSESEIYFKCKKPW